MHDFFNPHTRDAFVSQLAGALHEMGFVAVVNPGIDSDVLDRGYAAAEAYFRLDLDTKMQICDPSNNGQRGYVPGEQAKGHAMGDFKEFLHIGKELTPEQQSRLGYFRNIWPADFDLKTPMMALLQELEKHAEPLSMALAIALGQEEHFLSEMTHEGSILLRALHYPANPPSNTVWAAEHTDIDLFTILPRASAEGLQVKNKEGEWIDVVVPDNAFIVNAGDMLENLSNGKLRSSVHRVIAKGVDQERFSIVLFIHPRLHDRLDPLPSCIAETGGVPLFPEATSLELLEERLVDLGLASPEMLSHLAQSGLVDRLIPLGRASDRVMQRLQEAGLASPLVASELTR
jgi:isopenicillin N synthase-like dioxygenase